MPSALYFNEISLSRSDSLAVGSAWVYLGDSSPSVQKWEQLLGADHRIPTGRLIEKMALQIRETFVHWIEALASEQNDLDEFWALTFTTRSPETSDLFELLVLGKIALELKKSESSVVVIVQDPWLFEALSSQFDQVFGSREAKYRRSILTTVGSLRRPIARLGFFARGFARIIKARSLFPPGAPDAAWGVSYAFPQALAQAQYRDPFFGDLPQILTGLGERFRFLFPLHAPAGVFADIQRIPGATVLAAWATLGDLLHATLSSSRSRLERAHQFGELNSEPLMRREMMFELSSNRFVLNLWQARTWARFALRATGKVIFIFENHNWEKGLNSALSKTKTKLKRIGYQHSTLGQTLMNYIPTGPSEESFHPEFIISNCSENVRRLIEYGWPKERVMSGGSLRYLAGLSQVGAPRVETESINVYVAFPGAQALADNFSAALIRATRGIQGLRFFLKAHPSVPISAALTEMIPGSELTEQQLLGVSTRIDAVLYVSSTIGLEAALFGYRAIRYVPEGRLSLDPAPKELSGQMSTCDWLSLESTLRSISKRTTEEKLIPNAGEFLFGPLDLEVWRQALGSAARSN